MRTVAEHIVGGMSLISPTDENVNTLTSALQDDKGYSESVGSMRVCWSCVDSVYEQIVAGTKYWFNINGCNVIRPEVQDSVMMLEGKCSDTTLESCTPTPYQVQIWEKEWLNMRQVLSITQRSSSGGPDMMTAPNPYACTDQKPSVSGPPNQPNGVQQPTQVETNSL
ncbi:unnamed protein product [Peronospora farinosa]|uniref:Ricin B lectin domain-containing protein n=1 Tax=Peronospora farinosa TaxID=134698 RepID=A0AAV0T781_9STRA|nr:unnamed protein product [Peronospora farinosa]